MIILDVLDVFLGFLKFPSLTATSSVLQHLCLRTEEGPKGGGGLPTVSSLLSKR